MNHETWYNSLIHLKNKIYNNKNDTYVLEYYNFKKTFSSAQFNCLNTRDILCKVLLKACMSYKNSREFLTFEFIFKTIN